MSKFLVVTFAFLMFANSAFGEVIDSAGMFKKDTIDAVNKKISEIHSKHGKDLVVETFPEIGTENSSEFAVKKARERKVNGVYILIAKKEKRIEVKVGNKTKEVFGSFEATTLKDKLVSDFKSKNFDTGLNSSVDYFSQIISSGAEHRIADTRPVHAKPYNSMRRESSGGFSGIIMIVIFAIIGFIIFRVIRNMMNRNNQYNQNSGYGQPQGGMFGGGGGIMGSILGGVFGAMAGSWIYDKLTGRDNLYGSDRYSDSSSSYDNDSSSSSWSDSDDGSDYSSGDSGSFDGGDSGGDW